MFAAIASALAGLQAATTRAAVRSENIANLQSSGYRVGIPVQTAEAAGPVVKVERVPPDRAQTVFPGTNIVNSQVDLPAEIVDLNLSSIAYKASARVLKTVADMEKEAIDLLA